MKPALAFIASISVEQFNQVAGAVSLALTIAYTARLIWLSFPPKKK